MTKSSSISTKSQQPNNRSKRSSIRGRSFLTLLLILAFAWSLTSVHWGSSLIHTGGMSAIVEFFSYAFRPDLSSNFLGITLESTWTTIAYAIAGICVAVIIGLPLGIFASGVLNKSAAWRWPCVVAFRAVSGFLRSIHELVWAWLFVVALGLSPMAAILGLGIPYAGILGRIYADILNDVPKEPLRALRSSGASEWEILLYGHIPMSFPDLISYSFYRLECAIRAAAIMGFVGIGGLGMQIQLSLRDLHYDEVWTLLYALIALIVIIDAWSSWLRKSLT